MDVEDNTTGLLIGEQASWDKELEDGEGGWGGEPKGSKEEGAASTNGSLPGLPPVGEEEEEDESCPVECVTEFKTDEEFSRFLERSRATGALVVVDFFRPSCGSCKYIEQGFMKLCKGSGDHGSPVIFLKHNVRPYAGYLRSLLD
ncbi:unnamed protein product [Triticum turgidum subsp. durum]|uniref:Thioredoxin domain-containing protein n=1 Tax=Triticum turgidum subsp. durum TaxID=4567 RepID=A0A9R1RFE7_TRITD|nr:unnamed protein product [Triticum turgidum subsp. durum]